MKRYLTFGMKNLNESQIENTKNFSHKDLLAVDYCGKDSGIESWYAFDGSYLVLSVKRYESTGYGNTVFFTPCDASGKAQKVWCADGIQRYITIALTHMNDLTLSAGKVIPKNGRLYSEGTKGLATGNHIHCECANGIHYNKSYLNGVFKMTNALKPSKVFYLRPDKTKLISERLYKRLNVPTAPEDYLKLPYNKPSVGELQKCLNFVLGTELKIDNDFGKKTEAAVMQFQKEVGLTVNGRYGDNTKSKLKEILK